MGKETNVTYKIKGWDETAVEEYEGGKTVHVTVKKTYTGAIEGEGTQAYVMIYKANGTADYFGFEHIVGSVDGKSGSFTVREQGTFADGKATSELEVIPGNGTGELANLKGKGGYSAGHAESFPMWFEYEL